MLGYIYDFFQTFWGTVYDGTYGFEYEFPLFSQPQVNLFGDYLPILSTIICGVLIIAFLIGFVIWTFKFFASLIKR